MAAYLNGQVQAAYLNGQPQAAYLNGQLVIGGAVLLDLFTENYNNGTAEWTGFNNGFLELPAPNFGSLNPSDVNEKVINGLLTSLTLVSGNQYAFFGGPLGERLMQELGSKVHIFGPGYDEVWNFDRMDSASVPGNTAYYYLPDTEGQFPNNTLMTSQLQFEAFDISEMVAGATGDLIGYSVADGIGSFDPDFINGAQVTKVVSDTVALTVTIRVEAVVSQDWWGNLNVNGSGVGISFSNSVLWVFSTGPGFSEWEITYLADDFPAFANGETYDASFNQDDPVVDSLVAGSFTDGVDSRGWHETLGGTIKEDTYKGWYLRDVITRDLGTFEQFRIGVNGIDGSSGGGVPDGLITGCRLVWPTGDEIMLGAPNIIPSLGLKHFQWNNVDSSMFWDIDEEVEIFINPA